MLNVRKYLAVSTILLIPYAVSGCGPGFPIMTAEQQAMVKNVDSLLKDNDALKARVSALERGGGQSQSQLKSEVDAARRASAEANISIAKLREEFSFVQGSIEEGSHARDEMKDSVKTVNGSLKAMHENLASLDNASKDAGRKTDELKAAVDSIDKKTSSLQDAVAALDKRVADIESRPAQGAQTQGKKGPATDPEDLYARGIRDIEAKDYTGAMEAFQALLADYPAHKYAGNAQYWTAEIHYARSEWERAILEFDKVIKTYPKSEKVAASILKQGFAFENLGSKKEARVLLESVMDRFPKSPEAAIAKKRLQGMK